MNIDNYQEFMKVMVSSSLDALIIIDSDSSILEFSPAAEEIFGHKRRDVLGLNIADVIIPPSLRNAHHQGMKRYMSSGQGVVLGNRVEVTAIRKNGQKFPVELTVVPVKIDEKEYFTAFVRDTSEQKQKQEELESQTQKAELASQAKSRFLAHMSHEIRSPLNVILGAIELLQRTELSSEQLEHVRLAGQWGGLLSQQLESVLNFSNIESGIVAPELNSLDLKQLLSSVFARYRPIAEREMLRFNTELPLQQTLQVMADGQIITQIVNNFLLNAVKYIDDGYITARLVVLAETATHINVSIEVEDSGPGLTNEEIALVFKEFHRGKNVSPGGAGLGLAICKKLAESIGGQIDLRSTLGVGSCFSLSLSLVKAADSEGKVASSTSVISLNGKQVLIVEDTEANRIIVGAMLKELGMKVEFVGDGESAVESVGMSQPDVVLMDLRLPGMDGLEATRQIRRLPHGSKVPIIALSANAFESDKQQCIDEGMDGFLSKPITATRLSEAIAEVLMKHMHAQSDPIASATANGQQQVLDLEALQQLISDVGTDTVVDILQAVLKDISHRQSLIDQALMSNDHDTVADHAHALKSACVTVGFQQLGDVFLQLEQLGRSGNDLQSAENIPRLQRAMIAAQSAGKKYLSTLRS